jgi:hypothetical protein
MEFVVNAAIYHDIAHMRVAHTQHNMCVSSWCNSTNYRKSKLADYLKYYFHFADRIIGEVNQKFTTPPKKNAGAVCIDRKKNRRVKKPKILNT